MVADVRFLQQLDFPAYAVQLDWLMTDTNLIAEGYDLQSAVIVALGTDAMAPPDEPLPDPDATDRRGWWGDIDAAELWNGWPVGCLLWLLQRAKITGPLAEGGSTVARADGWTRDAMQHFVSHRIASRIDVLADRVAIDRIDVEVVIYRGPEPAIELRYAELWEELEHPTSEPPVVPLRPALSTWNPQDRHFNVTLSNGDLTHEAAVVYGGYEAFVVRSTTSRNRGKRYFEINIEAELTTKSGDVCIGVASIGTPLNAWPGDTGGSLYSAAMYSNGALLCGTNGAMFDPPSISFDTPAIVACAVDFDAGKVWFRNPAGWVHGDPIAGTQAKLITFASGQELFAATCCYSIPDKATTNFGNKRFTYPVPPGFQAWSALASTAFNPADKHEMVILTNDNTTATTHRPEKIDPPWDTVNVRSVTSHKSGRRYFEFRIISHVWDEYIGIGLGTSATRLDWWIDDHDNSCAFYNNGRVFQNNGNPAFIDTGKLLADGEWGAIAVNLDTGKGWVRDMTGWHGDPVAGTGNAIVFTPGTRLFHMISYWTEGDKTETNFGDTPFAYAPPSGFSPWSK